jgi:integrase/recombinase XerD
MKNPDYSIFSTRFSTKEYFVEINTSFTLRDTPDKSGKHIVYLLFSHKYKKHRLNTKIKVDKRYWKNSRVTSAHENASDINLLLGTIEAKINKIKVHWRLSDKVLTIEKLVEEFQTNTPAFDFISFFRHQLNIQDFKANTIKAQKSILKKLESYKPVIAFSEMDSSFFLAFKKHLKTKYKNKDNTVYSNIKTIKKYMRIAEEDGIKLGMPVKKLKVEKFRPKTTYLIPQEVKALKEYFTSKYLNPIHRLPLAYFLTACYTGMRISDLQNVKKELVKETVSFDQIKTDNFQFIKLNSEIRQLLENTPEFFDDFLSDQKINANLKKIAEICKIDKNLSMHVGRHTFATTYIRNGGSVVKLQRLLGHDNVQSTMHYVHIVDMEALEGIENFIRY